MTDLAVFVSKVAAKKKLKGLTNADLAKMTCYTEKTIATFMANSSGRPRSRKVARALAQALEMKMPQL